MTAGNASSVNDAAAAVVALNKADLELSERRGGRKRSLEEARRLARTAVPGATGERPVPKPVASILTHLSF